MTRIFIDTDVILDLLIDRHPYSIEAAAVFSLIEKESVEAFASSLSFSNLYYVLRKFSSHRKVISKLEELCDFIEILNVDGNMIRASLRSGFKDLEDAVQCFAAQGHPTIDVIITRNIKDYKPSALPVMTPSTFLKTYRHTQKNNNGIASG